MEGRRNRSGLKRIRSSRRQLPPPDLPEEIIQVIVSRLPVKSIVKFKCVSRSWLSFISSPQFVQAHLKHSAEKSDFASLRVLFTITSPQFNLKQCSASLLMSKRLAVPSSLDYPGKRPHAPVWVLGTCNGLLCHTIDDENGESVVYIWNPSTKKSRKLPPTGVQKKPGFYNLWGFGHCESDDDYKVVGIFCVFEDKEMQESTVMIYSSRADSWRRIADFRCGIPFDDAGKCANGKMHFSSCARMNFENRWNIVSIDLETGAYGGVEQPKYDEGCSCSSLGLYGGKLSLFCDFTWQRCELWVMEEYGVKESWSRLVSIPYFDDPGEALYTTPLVVMPNGDVLLMFGLLLVVYSAKDKCLKHPRLSNCSKFLCVETYFESLVPV